MFNLGGSTSPEQGVSITGINNNFVIPLGLYLIPYLSSTYAVISFTVKYISFSKWREDYCSY